MQPPDTATAVRSDALLERQSELDAAAAAVRDVTDGHGQVVVVEGTAGIGKTALVRAVLEDASTAGAGVLTARADELESGFPFGVMRQLLTDTLRGVDREVRAMVRRGPGAFAASLLEGDTAAARETATGDSGLAEAYSFAALVGELFRDDPVVMAVDDAQWADVSSLRAIHLLVRRLSDLPCGVVLAVRSPSTGVTGELLSRLADDPTARRLELEPLGEDAVGELTARVTGQQPDAQLRHALRRATGGNPFLIRELLTSIDVEGTGDLPRDEGAIAELVPDSIVRFALRRIDTLGQTARRLAEAVAVFGQADLVDAAWLAEIDERTALVAADQLAAHQILVPGDRWSMTHPVLREAVARSIPPARRAMLHSKTARRLNERGASVERVAGHLLEGLPRADPWVVDRLRDAAKAARDRGAPEAATVLLERALNEPPSPAHRFDVTFELGVAQAAQGDPGATATLERAVELARHPGEEVAARVRLARAVGLNGDIPRGIELVRELDREAPDGVDRDLLLQLEAELLGFARLDPATRPAALERLEELGERALPPRPASAVLLANLALTAVEHREGPGRVAELADAALVDDVLIDAGSFQLAYAVGAFTWIDDYERSTAIWDRVVGIAERRGALTLSAMAQTIRSRVALRAGRVADAHADGRRALEILLSTAQLQGVPFARAHLADALLVQGQIDHAARVLEEASPDENAQANPQYLDSLGRLALARHNAAEAYELFRRCGQALDDRGGVDAPSIIAWRSHASVAAWLQGDVETAKRLANEELELAEESQVAGSTGRAHLTLGTIDDDPERLADALRILEDTPRRLTTIRALTTLGASLRRSGQRQSARPHLARALDLAHRCGATALADQARDELHASGAQPRRDALIGVEALTPSEQRVADLAASGLTNRQIAAELVVSVRTVTTHLTHVYRKLQINGRNELADRLEHD